MTELEELKKRFTESQNDEVVRLFDAAILADMRQIKKIGYDISQKPWAECVPEKKE